MPESPSTFQNCLAAIRIARPPICFARPMLRAWATYLVEKLGRRAAWELLYEIADEIQLSEIKTANQKGNCDG